MISVEEAEQRILDALVPTPIEWVYVASAAGRVLARDLAALRDQPGADVSAMDGYAVRAAEAIRGAVLEVEGEAAAGALGGPPLTPGTARRIFTGGIVPEAADTVLIQENAEPQGGRIRVVTPAEPDRHIRRQGHDFRAGSPMMTAGRRLGARDLGLAVSLGHGHLPVHRRPRVGLAATGSELVRPGTATTPAQVPNSNAVAVAAAIESFGGDAVDLGIVPDTQAAIAALAADAGGLDLLVTTGGASVGEHDLVRSGLCAEGLALDFWRIAMRPGKPLLFGRLGDVPVLGLPGNPVSALVCALLFVRSAIAKLGGSTPGALPLDPAVLAGPLPANDHRRDFMRARLERSTTENGGLRVVPFDRQDSSMLGTLAHADALIVRPPHAPAQACGTLVWVVPFKRFASF